jgi:threonyl-tRNA synthetase
VHLEAGDMRALIKEAQGRRANYMLVVGDKEAAAGTVSVRRRGSRDTEPGVPLATLVERLTAERDSRALPPDFTGPREETVAASIA